MGMKNVDEQEKLEARKMLDREACRTPEGQSHASSVSMKAQSNRLRSGTFLGKLRVFSERERVPGNAA